MDIYDRIEEVLNSWPLHDVGSCQNFACKDCVVEACRDDITNALDEPYRRMT